jgi:tetratricopeptide (TPR) repeat protein
LLCSGKYSLALQLTSRRDLCRLELVKALRALALARSGQHANAMALCREVAVSNGITITPANRCSNELNCSSCVLVFLQAHTPTDDDVLLALGAALKAMEAYADMTVLFENAAKMQPTNTSLLREVFLCAVRQRDYLRAQQVATRLYKAEGGNAAAGRYMCCAAACSLVQARRTGSTAFLPLAERMIAKALTDRAAAAAEVAAAAAADGASQPPRYTGEEVTLYTTLLREQGKPQEALAALERLTAAGAAPAVNDAVVDQSSVEQGTVVALSWAERCELEADLLQEVGLHERAAATFASLIAAHPDQWTYYMRYFDLIEVRSSMSSSLSGVT